MAQTPSVREVGGVDGTAAQQIRAQQAADALAGGKRAKPGTASHEVFTSQPTASMPQGVQTEASVVTFNGAMTVLEGLFAAAGVYANSPSVNDEHIRKMLAEARALAQPGQPISSHFSEAYQAMISNGSVLFTVGRGALTSPPPPLEEKPGEGAALAVVSTEGMSLKQCLQLFLSHNSEELRRGAGATSSMGGDAKTARLLGGVQGGFADPLGLGEPPPPDKR